MSSSAGAVFCARRLGGGWANVGLMFSQTYLDLPACSKCLPLRYELLFGAIAYGLVLLNLGVKRNLPESTGENSRPTGEHSRPRRKQI